MLKAFSENKPPVGTEVIVYNKNKDNYRIARYANLGGTMVWRLQNNSDWFPTEDTYWCLLPERPQNKEDLKI